MAKRYDLSDEAWDLIYLVDFRKSIDGLVALVELEIKVAVFDPVMFVFINRARNQVKVLYWERNGPKARPAVLTWR